MFISLSFSNRISQGLNNKIILKNLNAYQYLVNGNEEIKVKNGYIFPISTVLKKRCSLFKVVVVSVCFVLVYVCMWLCVG